MATIIYYHAVCERCMVKCVKHHKDNGNWGMISWSECPICGNGDPQLDTDDCGLTDDELESNRRFLMFMKGQDPDETIGETWD